MNLIDRCLYIYTPPVQFTHIVRRIRHRHIGISYHNNIISSVYTLRYWFNVSCGIHYQIDVYKSRNNKIRDRCSKKVYLPNILLCINTRVLGRRRCPRNRVSNFLNAHWTRFPTPRWRIYTRNEKQTPIRKKNTCRST